MAMRGDEMAYGSPTAGAGSRLARFALLWLVSALFAFSPWGQAAAQTKLPGYAQAEDAFMRLTLDERVKLQILLTAAGYWPAVPDADFSTRLFNAILRFEVDNGFTPLGVLNDEQMDRLMAIAGPYLNAGGFSSSGIPMTNSQIWVPFGLPLTEESTATGLTFVNRPLGVVLTYDFFPAFTLRASFESLASKLGRDGATIYYSKLYGNEFFVFSYSDGMTDAYVRYHQDRARRRRFHAHLEPCGDGRPYRTHRHADFGVALVVGVRRSLHLSVHRQDRERGTAQAPRPAPEPQPGPAQSPRRRNLTRPRQAPAFS